MPGVLAVLHVHLSPRPDLSAPPASGVLLEHLVPVGTPARLSGLVPSNPASHIITLAPRGSCAAIVAPTSLIGSLVLSNSTLLCGLWVVLAAPTHSDSLEPVNSMQLHDLPTALAAPVILGPPMLFASTRLPPPGSVTQLTLPPRVDEPISLGSLSLREQYPRSDSPAPSDFVTHSAVAPLAALHSCAMLSQPDALHIWLTLPHSWARPVFAPMLHGPPELCRAPQFNWPSPHTRQLSSQPPIRRPTSETTTRPPPSLYASPPTPNGTLPMIHGWHSRDGFLATRICSGPLPPAWLPTHVGQPPHDGFPAARVRDGALLASRQVAHARTCHDHLAYDRVYGRTSDYGPLFHACLTYAVGCSGGATTSINPSATAAPDFSMIYGAGRSGGAGTSTNSLLTTTITTGADRSGGAGTSINPSYGTRTNSTYLSFRSMVATNVTATAL